MSTKEHPEQQYLDLMQEILDNGVKQVDDGTGVVTHSLFGRMHRYDLSGGTLPLLTTKKVYWNGVLQELYWFLSGQENIKYLVDNNVHIWDDYPYKIYKEKISKGILKGPDMTKEEFIEKLSSDGKFAKAHGSLEHVYGSMWRKWPAKDGREIDQLAWATNEIVRDPDCHNAIVSAWNPEYLYTMAKENEACRFPVCHIMYQLNVKNKKVSLLLFQRTADIFLGVPFNIASYALLTMIIAKVTGYEPGEFIHVFGDVHVYDNHIEQAKEQLTRKPRPFPTVTISDEVISLDAFRPEHVTLAGYDPHPTLKGELSVVGGFHAGQKTKTSLGKEAKKK